MYEERETNTNHISEIPNVSGVLTDTSPKKTPDISLWSPELRDKIRAYKRKSGLAFKALTFDEITADLRSAR